MGSSLSRVSSTVRSASTTATSAFAATSPVRYSDTAALSTSPRACLMAALRWVRSLRAMNSATVIPLWITPNASPSDSPGCLAHQLVHLVEALRLLGVQLAPDAALHLPLELALGDARGHVLLLRQRENLLGSRRRPWSPSRRRTSAHGARPEATRPSGTARTARGPRPGAHGPRPGARRRNARRGPHRRGRSRSRGIRSCRIRSRGGRGRRLGWSRGCHRRACRGPRCGSGNPRGGSRRGSRGRRSAGRGRPRGRCHRRPRRGARCRGLARRHGARRRRRRAPDDFNCGSHPPWFPIVHSLTLPDSHALGEHKGLMA